MPVFGESVSTCCMEWGYSTRSLGRSAARGLLPVTPTPPVGAGVVPTLNVKQTWPGSGQPRLALISQILQIHKYRDLQESLRNLNVIPGCFLQVQVMFCGVGANAYKGS